MGDWLSRRDLLKAGGALAAAAVGPQLGLHDAMAQTPKRGGTISLRLWDPPHFDPHLTISYKTNILNDPVLGDMLIRQRRTADVAKRRELLHEIQRHVAKQQYYVYAPSGVYIGVWDAALKNYVPNLGYDWGGRLLAAWLDR